MPHTRKHDPMNCIDPFCEVPTPAPTPVKWHWQQGEKYNRLYSNVPSERGEKVSIVLVATKVNGSKMMNIKQSDLRLIAAAPRMLAFIKAGHCDDDEAAAILKEIQG